MANDPTLASRVCAGCLVSRTNPLRTGAGADGTSGTLAPAVDTAERYQGDERDIIILSMALGNSGQMPFLQSLAPFRAENGDLYEVDRKLNVALTRAREHLILIGARELLLKGKFYHKLVRWMEGEL